MYRVIIVEDEMLVRIGLKNSVQWDKFGMQVVGDADDGTTAMELYEMEKPDLIITDLKMPGMSGMDLIAAIREHDRNVKFIILTCLEEFELVRKAISMGVSDYILKLTMTMGQINAVLQRVCDELSADKSRQAAKVVSNTDISVIKEKIIKDYILFNIHNEKDFTALAEKCGFRFGPERMVLCILEMDHPARVKILFEDENGQLIKHVMLNILDEMLANFEFSEVVYDCDARYIIIFSFGQSKDGRSIIDEIKIILKEIESPARSFFNTTVSYGLSEIKSGYSNLRNMYEQALHSLENKFIGGDGIYGPGIAFNRNLVKNVKTDEMLKLCENITGVSSSFFNEYSERIRSIMNDEAHSRIEYLEMFCRLIQWMVNALKFQEDGSEQIIISAIQSIQQSETIDEAYRFLYEFLSRVSAAKKKRIASREVKLALDYMETNYTKDISLQEVSTHVGLSQSYLSSLFKKEIEVNFVEYLNEIRIDKAKELLLETYLRTYEIAENVGFNETTYFCKIFKKLTGTTPSEYRKQWLKKWTEDTDDENNHQ